MKENASAHPTLRQVNRILSGLLLLLGIFLSVAVGYGVYAAHDLDPTREAALFETYSRSLTTRLYANEGGFQRGAISEREYRPVLLDTVCGSEDRIWCDPKELPRYLGDAFVAIEDRRFYQHDGVDWLRTAKAALNSVFRTERRFGGSTITQQLVKNVSGESSVTLRRKVREIIRATALEKRLSKEEILTFYLNVIPLANRCFGVGAASRFYFGKTPSELTLSEAATLAAITNAPSRYDPVRFPEENRRRRDLILRKMAEYGYIGEEEAEEAMREEIDLDLSLSKGGTRIRGWYTEQVISEVTRDLMQKLGISRESAERLVYLGGLKIYTLCDPELQEATERYLERYDPKDAEGGVVLLDPRDGALLAISGSIGEKKINRGQNYASQVRRPPGSTLKPIALYAPALSRSLISCAEVFEDQPIEMPDGSLWPRNTPNVYAGRISASEALAKSKNTVACRLYEMLGAKEIADSLSADYHIEVLRRGKGGLSDLAPAPLALGQLTYGTTLLEMTAAYGVFASGGVYRAPRSYLAVYAEDGGLLLDNSLSEHRVLREAEAFIMTDMLRGVVKNGTASSLTLQSCIDLAAKTGTSGEGRDRWMIGYTSELVLGVLMTGKEGEPLSSGARQIALWEDLMSRFYSSVLSGAKRAPSFRVPRGVIRLPYCPDSGKLIGEYCLDDLRGARIAYGYFTPENLPHEKCDTHVPILYDPISARFFPSHGPWPRSPFVRRVSALDDRNRKLSGAVIPLDRQYDLSLLLSHENEGEKVRKNRDFLD